MARTPSSALSMSDSPAKRTYDAAPAGGRTISMSGKLSLELTPAQAEWITQRRMKTSSRSKNAPPMTLKEVFHRLIDDQMERDRQEELRVQATKGKPETKEMRQRRWLAAIEEHYTVRAACRVTGIERKETDEWAKDEAFKAAFDEARWVAVEDVESSLLSLGAGVNKGHVVALIAFLNAHHPEYGRIKAEQLGRILGPLIKRFYQVVLQEAGEKIGARIKERMEEIADARLADFSD